MTAANDQEREIKVCCAAFYESDVARLLLGDVFHPGGLELTHHLGQRLGLGPGDRVLDVACGRGAPAVHLAKSLGCNVTGLDYGAQNIEAARALAVQRGVEHLTTFRTGDAEGLPFENGSFDAVLSECSFCTFPDKTTAAAEMARVLSPAGRLGLTDMTVNGPLPEEIQGLLGWVACVSGAGASEDYVAALRAAGLGGFEVEDHQETLLDMVADVRRKVLGLELVAKLNKIDLGDLDLDSAKLLARRAVELIECGIVGYTLIAAQKSEP